MLQQNESQQIIVGKIIQARNELLQNVYCILIKYSVELTNQCCRFCNRNLYFYFSKIWLNLWVSDSNE